MNTLSYKTKSLRKEDVEAAWWIVDAENQVVGRLASQISHILRGKHKASYTPHINCGDYVVVINADKVRFTGKKMTDKAYYRYSGYPGGQRKTTPEQLMAKKPEAIMEKAVNGMLPKNRLGRQIYKKLFVYAGAEHPHHAQQPQELKFEY